MSTYTTKCLILGSGSAGCTAGIYTGRANLKPIILTGLELGGQLSTTPEVENYPGYDHISGFDLMEKMRQQAEKCGATLISDAITDLDVSKRPFVAKSASNEYIADTIIIATGAQAMWLGCKGEAEYKGFGVSACATCDGPFYKGRVVAVVGGGNTAITEALYLSTLAKKVYLIHRRDTFKAEQVLIDKLQKTENIELVVNSQIDEILGDEDAIGKFVNGINVKNNNGNITNIELDGVFVAIGHKPSTEIFKGKIDLTERGYIKTNPITKETSVKGIWSAGDVQNENYKQAIVAAGDGCVCALEVERFLGE